MTLESEDGIIASHPFAVVRYTHQPAAAKLDIDLNSAGLGIDRIFYQLLDDRRRTFDDLAGRDLIGERIG